MCIRDRKYNIIKDSVITDDIDIPDVVFIDDEYEDPTITTHIMTGVRAIVGEKAWIFNTTEEMEEWLNNPSNIAKLNAGDDIRIIAEGASNYWWDGNQLRVTASGLTIEEVARSYREAVNNVFK